MIHPPSKPTHEAAHGAGVQSIFTRERSLFSLHISMHVYVFMHGLFVTLAAVEEEEEEPEEEEMRSSCLTTCAGTCA